MQVLLHDVPNNGMTILSGRDIPSTGDVRTVARTSVRYGQQIVVTLSQFVSLNMRIYFLQVYVTPIILMHVLEKFPQVSQTAFIEEL